MASEIPRTGTGERGGALTDRTGDRGRGARCSGVDCTTVSACQSTINTSSSTSAESAPPLHSTSAAYSVRRASRGRGRLVVRARAHTLTGASRAGADAASLPVRSSVYSRLASLVAAPTATGEGGRRRKHSTTRAPGAVSYFPASFVRRALGLTDDDALASRAARPGGRGATLAG